MFYIVLYTRILLSLRLIYSTSGLYYPLYHFTLKTLLCHFHST